MTIKERMVRAFYNEQQENEQLKEQTKRLKEQMKVLLDDFNNALYPCPMCAIRERIHKELCRECAFFYTSRFRFEEKGDEETT